MRMSTPNLTTFTVTNNFMRNIFSKLLMGLLLFLAAVSANAQSSANYNFAVSSTASLTDMSSGTTQIIAAASDDGASAVTNIGFEFWFMGARYTQFSASSNGFLRLGGTAVGTTQYTLGSASIPLISSLGSDLETSSTGRVHYKLVGFAPNRMLVVEFRTMTIIYDGASDGQDGTSQVRLYESSNAIELVYGSMNRNNSLGFSSANNPQYIGFSINNTANSFATVNTADAVATTGTPTANLFTMNTAMASLNSVADGARKMYTFTPNATTAPSGLNFTAVNAAAMTLNWTDNSSDEAGFAIYRSTDGINYSFITTTAANAITSVQGGLTPSTNYFWKVYAVREALSLELAGSQSTTPAGNIVSTGAGGLWNTPGTWVGGAVPNAGDNVTIADGTTVTIDLPAAAALSLTVGQGTSGILIYQATPAASLTVGTDVTVAAGGTFQSAATGTTTTHTLSLPGNLINNGIIDFSTNTNTAGAAVVFTGAASQSVTGTGATTDLFLVTMSKSALANVVEFNLSNFSVRGLSAAATGALLTSAAGTGTIKFSGSNTFSGTLWSAAGYTIPATLGFWLNNPNFTITGQNGSPTTTGLLRISQGTYNIGTSTGNSMGFSSGSTIIIEGGAVNAAGRFGVATSTNAITYNQSGGTITVCTAGNASTTLASFDLGTAAASTISWSNGTVVCQLAATGLIDYRMQSGTGFTALTGGTLQLGNAASGAAKTFIFRGLLPLNTVITNTSAGHSLTLPATAPATYVYGVQHLTINTGCTFTNLQTGTNPEFFVGNVTNDGTFTSTTAGNRVYNTGALGIATTWSGTGTFTPGIPSFEVDNALGVTLSTTNQIPANRIIVFNGAFTNCNKFTLGNGGTTTGIIQIGNTTTPTNAGVFDAAPTFNLGTGGQVISYLRTTLSRTTGPEVNPGRVLTTMSYDDNDISHSLTIAGGNLATGTLALTNGVVNTNASNLVTVTGTATTNITRTTGYVNGPLERTLPASLLTGSTYLFPVGTTTYNPYELVNPTTNAGGTVVLQAQAFDGNAGGTPGLNMLSLNTTRYWLGSITSGAGNFTNTALRLTDAAGLGSANGIARSATQTGAYDLVGGNSIGTPANSITSDAITSFGYFVMGEKALLMSYTSSATTQTVFAPIIKPATNQQIIGVQIVTSGNNSPLSATSFTFNTNGSTAPGTDISTAKLWYTGTSGTFATTTQFGTDFVSPNGSFVINGSQVLAEGTNYFWLTYDIPGGAVLNNVVDAECNSLTVGSAFVPVPQAVAGTRKISAPLNGLYVIGASQVSPNYTNLTNAISDLNALGVSGAVIFELAADYTSVTETYPLVINTITGGSAVNTLTVRPGAGVAAVVTGSSASAIIKLNGADYVTIDGLNTGGSSLTFSNTNAGTSSAVIWVASASVSDGATNNTIRNCNVTGNSSTTTLGAIVSSSGTTMGGVAETANSNNTYSNNAVKQAMYGLAIVGPTGNEAGTVITSNTVGSTVTGEKIGLRGIAVFQQQNVNVSNNTVMGINSTNTGANSFASGIAVLGTASGGTINANNISDIKKAGAWGCAGITINSGSPGVGLTVSNNFIYDIAGGGYGSGNGIDDNGSGIIVNAGSGWIIHYNSINMATSQATAASFTQAINVSSGVTAAGALDIRNNILVNSTTNTTGRYGIYSGATAAVYSSIDYNDYYTAGTLGASAGLGFLGTSQTTLAAMQSSFGGNLNSQSAQPTFISATDLHLVGADGNNFNFLESKGVAVTVTTDIDAQSRPNGTAPDIGADEFVGIAGDLTPPAISYTLFTNTLCNTDRTFTGITITDLSGVNTTAGTKPRLYYKKSTDANTYAGNTNADNGWKFVEATNATSPFTFTTSYALLQSAVAAGDVIQYFVTAQDLAGTPNVGINSGIFNAIPASVALTAGAFPVTGTINSYTIVTGLSADVLVGTGEVYTTLTGTGGLFEAINNGGLSANITARITSSITEPGTIALNTISYGCAGTNTLTIKPNVGVTATLSGTVPDAPVIMLNGASNVIIDGSNAGTSSRDLTITNTDFSFPNVIAMGSAGTTPITNITLKNCVILNGDISSSAVVLGDAAILGDPGYFNNITIQNNVIQRAFIGVFAPAVPSPGNGSGLNITSNDLSTSGANAISFMGIYVEGVDGATIQNNVIGNFDNLDDEDDTGIWAALGTVNTTIRNNRISGLNYTGTGGYGAHGIYVSTGTPAANVTVSNNSIYNLTGDGWNYTSASFAEDNPIGIVLSGTQTGINVYFNSINLTGNTLNQTDAMSMGMRLGAGSVADIRNNIIVNNLGIGGAGYGSVGIYAVTSNAQFTNINYNDYYVNPTGAGVKYLGQIAATGSANLAAWQAATGQDANSVSVDPLFTSNTNLNLTGGSPLIGAGVTIAGQTTDITGATRNNPPSIGAYEDKVVISTRLYLSGAYSAGLLRHKNVTAAWAAVLNANALTQPYGALTNNFGPTSVAGGFFTTTDPNGAASDIIDWVLVDLRDATTPGTIIAQRAAFVREDGLVVDVDGVSPVSFKGITAGNYFITIRHRNHLGVRTAADQLVDGNAGVPVVYDLTTVQASAFQNGAILTNGALTALGGGRFGLWGGNANANTTVRASGGANPAINDYAFLVNTALGGDATITIPNVYANADLNMDGTIRANGGANPAINDYAFLVNSILGGSATLIITQHQ